MAIVKNKKLFNKQDEVNLEKKDLINEFEKKELEFYNKKLEESIEESIEVNAVDIYEHMVTGQSIMLNAALSFIKNNIEDQKEDSLEEIVDSQELLENDVDQEKPQSEQKSKVVKKRGRKPSKGK